MNRNHCNACNGVGWLYVDERYVAAQPEEQRAASRNTVYQCEVCKPKVIQERKSA